jgi:aspartyl-tRNA(Asn)/glutamyl-tRNA(Gln) amidotransferase subunit A
MRLCELTLEQLSKMLERKECSSLELTRSVFERIHEVENKIHAYLWLNEEMALSQAKEADRLRQAGEKLNPLLGIPVALKDIFCTRGIPTTCASKILENFVPPFDATVVLKLKERGVVIVGKTNMDEFAMGSTTEGSAFGPTHNPWALEYIPGGSSGGSAAALSADMCIASLGTDTGGSIRQPAACCSVCGIKPTYGRVSRYGVIAYASSLDQVGPFGKTVRDTAMMLQAIAGFDPLDSTSVPREVPGYLSACTGEVKGLKIGLPREYFVPGMDQQVKSAVQAAAKELEKAGAELLEVSLPHTEYCIATYYIIAPSEASSNLARYDGVRYGLRVPGNPNILLNMYKATRTAGFSPEVRRRIIIGTYTLSAGYYDAYYLKAQKVRTLIRRDFEEAFQKCDVLLTPVLPTPPYKLGTKINDPLEMYLSDIFTVSCNLAGLPGMTVPCGFSQEHLPIGMQLLARPFEEEKIFQVAYAYEQATDWHKRKPPL